MLCNFGNHTPPNNTQYYYTDKMLMAACPVCSKLCVQTHTHTLYILGSGYSGKGQRVTLNHVLGTRSLTTLFCPWPHTGCFSSSNNVVQV